MDDEPTPATKPVSFDKRTPDGARSRPSLLGRGKPNLAADGSPMPPPPKQVRYAAIALCVSALAAIVAAIGLFGHKDYLLRSYRKNNPDPGKKGHQSLSALQHAADIAPRSNVLASSVLAIALLIAARGVIRGRHWSRWTVIILWVLATLTGTLAGFTFILSVGSDGPLVYRIGAFVSAAAIIVAVGYVNLRPSVTYFALSKPPRPAGAPARRGGLFGPRPAPAAATPAAPRTSPGREPAERSRSKQRASSESVAKGAELARARAKASKSRRTGV